MNEQMVWFALVAIMVPALPILVFALMQWNVARKLRQELAFIRCGEQGDRLAQCLLIRDRKTRLPLEIKACSALENPREVNCGKTCLPQLHRPDSAEARAGVVTRLVSKA